MSLIVRADIELAMGVQRLIDCTDDDHDGHADTPVIDRILADASAVAEVELQAGGFLLPLSTVTPYVRAQVAWIAAHLAARRRPEWHDDQGRAPFWQEHEQARKRLGEFAARARRPEGQSPTAIIVSSQPRRGW